MRRFEQEFDSYDANNNDNGYKMVTVMTINEVLNNVNRMVALAAVTFYL